MWRRWTCCLGAALLIAACSHGTLTRVVRTDGTIVVGELTAARPDAVVLKLADGSSITIPRSIIKIVESAATPPPAAVANNAGKASNPTAVPKGGATTATTTTTPTTPTPSSSTPPVTGPATSVATAKNPTPAAPGTKPVREAVAPSGTTLELALSAPIGSDSSNVDDKVDAVLRAPIVINGEPIVEAGAVAHGTVTEATPSEKAEGRGRLSVRFDAIQLGTRSVSIQTTPMHWEASGIARKPAADARGGKRSVFGKLVDKTKKGLHIGDDDAPRGSAEVRVAAGAVLRVRLEQPTRIAP
jgi:hypothetical protein